jgi:hypothetical protein
MNAAAGRVAGLSVDLTTGVGYLGTHPLTTDDTLIVGIAFRLATLPAAHKPVIELYDGTTLGMSVHVDPAGSLSVYKATTLVATTSTVSLSATTWYYLEFKVKCSATGTYEVKLDNVSVASNGSYNTKAGTNNYHDRVMIQNAGGSESWLDDYYICDSTGSLNNDFLGPCRVVAINPSADDAVNWSTVYPALSDHYADVDDGATCDDDTTYVEDNTTGHRDLFDYANATIVTSIYGLSINTTCRVTDANSVDLKTVVVSGANESTTTDAISSTDYLTKSVISETDPNTSSAWDVSNINSAFFGIEVG